MRNIKYFRPSDYLENSSLNISGVGIEEKMKPCIVDRPDGTGDFFLLYFDSSGLIGAELTKKKVCQGGFIIYPHSSGHYYGNPEIEWIHSWLHFSGNLSSSLIAESGLQTGKIYRLEDDKIIHKNLLEVYLELVNYLKPDNIILHNLLQNMLRQIARKLSSDNIIPEIPENILKAKKYLMNKLDKRISLDEIARIAHLSVPHMSYLFKKYIGISPVEYHIKLKMKKAEYLLKNRNITISEIGEAVGYIDIHHFSKLFKKYLGESPGKFRKNKKLQR